MALDNDDLKAAKQWADLVSRRKQDLKAAEANHRHAIRRLHASGGSLSEIAKELGLSRQRIHQIVSASGGIPGRRRRKADTVMPCSFCDRKQTASGGNLIAGPTVRICADCVVEMREVLGDDQEWRTCSFCAVTGKESGGIARRKDRTVNICQQCLDLCDQIISDQVAT